MALAGRGKSGQSGQVMESQTPNNAELESSEPRLESWKEIAAYLQRNTTTARRWEREEGLPVHRHSHKRRASVYAYPSELNAWREGRKRGAESEPDRVALWGSPLSSFATGTLLLLALISVGDPSSDVLRAQAQPAPEMAFRRVWEGPMMGTVSPDGKYLSDPDPDGELMLHNFVSGSDIRLSDKGEAVNDFAEFSAISRDGAQVAYTWWDDDEEQYQLRVLPIPESGGTPRQLADYDEVEWIRPFDWSPDNAWIAVEVERRDRTTFLGVVKVADGSLRVLKSLEWRRPDGIWFSPDSRYLAYDLPVGDPNSQHDIFVMAVDGSQESVAVEHPAFEYASGWSPDGKLLLFTSDRTEGLSLWGIPIKDGRPAGEPQSLRHYIGSGRSLGLTASGTLYWGTGTPNRDLQIAALDLSTGRLLTQPLNPISDYVGKNRSPAWSPDGRQIAFVRSRQFGRTIGILTVETGGVRELRPPLAAFNRPRWSPDGRTLALEGTDSSGRRGIYLMDVEQGGTSPMIQMAPGDYALRPTWSRDGSKIYYTRALDSDDGEVSVMEHNLATHSERELFRSSLEMVTGVGFSLSPDGNWLAVRLTALDGSEKSLVLIPTLGGEPRELTTALNIRPPTWAPDSSAIIVGLKKEGGEAYWRLPLSGGEPTKLDWEIPVSWIDLHPDGRQITYSLDRTVREVWALENFLPRDAEEGN